MCQYQQLKTLSLDHQNVLVAATREGRIDLDSPARLVVDLFSPPPLTLSSELGVDAALRQLHEAHQRVGLVVNGMEEFLGIITLADLESRKVLGLATSAGVARSDLTLADLMTPRAALLGIPLSAVETGRVGDLLQTLERAGQTLMVVLEPESLRICGIVSASAITRRLQLPLAITPRATRFHQLVDVISSGRDLA